MMKNKNQEPITHSDFNSLFGELKKDVMNYSKHRLDYIKLDLIEKSSKVMAKLAIALALICISLVVFTFLTITIGVYMGQLFDNVAAGFGVLVLIWLALLLFVYLCRNSLKRIIRDRCMLVLYQIQKEEDEDENE